MVYAHLYRNEPHVILEKFRIFRHSRYKKIMEYENVLGRMPTELLNPVRYFLDMGDDFIILNNLIGKEIEISFNKYQCLSCGQDIPIFAQGMCKKCYFESPQTGEWVMKPELSQAHLGKADRDLAFEQEVQLQPHIVYLAKTSDIKVGVTRQSQVPYRWIDQGADEAVPILKTPNRYLAGQAEVLIKKHITDKTGWQKMLKGISTNKNILEVKNQVKNYLPDELLSYWIDDAEPVKIHYPVHRYPEKVKSIQLDKTPEFKGKLTGIKGQYLIFDDGRVFNVRNHSGYVVQLHFD